MMTAFNPKNQVVLYSIHESDRGQKVRWLLEEMAAPYGVVNVIHSISCRAASSAALNAAPRKFVFDAGLISTTTVTRSGTKVSPTIVQLHRFRSFGVIASSCPIRSRVLRKSSSERKPQ